MSRRFMCKHAWVANDGKGGRPKFAWRGPRPGPETMRAVCHLCGHAAWFNENQWNGFMPSWAVESLVQPMIRSRAQRAAVAARKHYPPPQVRPTQTVGAMTQRQCPMCSRKFTLTH